MSKGGVKLIENLILISFVKINITCSLIYKELLQQYKFLYIYLLQFNLMVTLITSLNIHS